MGIAVVVAALLACKGIQTVPTGQVECFPQGLTLDKGFRCVARHTGGPAARLCWDIVIDCTNGPTVTAGNCADVNQGGSSIAYVTPHPDAVKQCASVSTMRLTEIRATAR